MLKIELLEANPDLEALLEPKRRIHEIVDQASGSMQKFHTAVKTSKELEDLADRFFNMKQVIKNIQTRSANMNMVNLISKIDKIKAVKAADTVDFV